MDKELGGKVSDFIENQDREQLRRLIDMDEYDVDFNYNKDEWKKKFNLTSADCCASCNYGKSVNNDYLLCEKHNDHVEFCYICDLFNS